MPRKSFLKLDGGELQSDLSADQVKAAIDTKQGLLWIDISDTDESDAEFLTTVMGFHSLPVEDCLKPDIHAAKIEQFRGYVFLICHGINYSVDSDLVQTVELSLFIGPNYVVTNHNFPVEAVTTVFDRVDRTDIMDRGADFLAHAIIDELIDDIGPTLDHMSAVVDQIEAEVLDRPTAGTLEAIMRTKRSALRIMRIIVPQRDTISRAARGEFRIIQVENRLFYSDVYDHLVRIGDRTQSLRELADGAVATYFASVSFRQNETMKTLSVVASVFLPLGLLAGIYGMNFETMPELSWKPMYFVVLGIVATTLTTVFWLYWGRRFLTRPKQTAMQLWNIPLAEVKSQSARASNTVSKWSQR